MPRRRADGRLRANRTNGRHAGVRRIGSPVLRRDRSLRPILARRGARQLEKHVVERRPAQPEIAHRDSRLAQRGGGLLDHLEPIPWRRKRQLREPVARLGRTATDPGQRLPGPVPLRRADQLEFQDLPADPVLELAPGPLRDHPTVIDHGDLLRELICLLEVLSGQQERRPLADELAHDRPNLDAAARIEAGRRLVQEQHARAGQQTRRQVETPPHTTGVRAGGAVGGVSQIEALQQLVRPRASIRGREVKQPPEHFEVLPAGQDLVDRGKLAGQPQKLTDARGVVDDVVAENLGPSGVRSEQRGQHPNERRLPGAVRSEQTKDGGLLDVQVDPRKRGGRPKALDQTLDMDSRISGHSPSSNASPDRVPVLARLRPKESEGLCSAHSPPQPRAVTDAMIALAQVSCPRRMMVIL